MYFHSFEKHTVTMFNKTILKNDKIVQMFYIKPNAGEKKIDIENLPIFNKSVKWKLKYLSDFQHPMHGVHSVSKITTSNGKKYISKSLVSINRQSYFASYNSSPFETNKRSSQATYRNSQLIHGSRYEKGCRSETEFPTPREMIFAKNFGIWHDKWRILNL